MPANEAATYYCACALLWWGFSIHDDVFPEDVVDPLTPEGYSKISDVAVWLLDEVFAAEVRADIRACEAGISFASEMEGRCDSVTVRWGDRLIDFAQNAEADWKLPKAILPYYLVSKFELGAVFRFKAVISELSFPRKDAYERECGAASNALIEYLHDEARRIEVENEISQVHASEARSMVDSLLKEWESTVHQLAASFS